jgi:hypothetical protein
MNALRWILALPFLVLAWLCLLTIFVLTGSGRQTFGAWLVECLIGILNQEGRV